MNLPKGPLSGVRVLEFTGIGPGPLCGMLLADMGADVLLVERPDNADTGIPRARKFEVAHRGKRSLVLNLKVQQHKALALDLAERADVVIEGFRPGTMERLGLGPESLLANNPRLIYGRMTGYGQDGPMSQQAGHDLNYISLTGVLHSIGRKGQPPTPPLNLVGDYAGGSMLLAMGILAALVERGSSGQGQVIDASMVDGSALLMAPHFGMLAAGIVTSERGANILDSGAPYYDVYRCNDGKYVAFGAIEHKFRRVFATRAGFEEAALLSDDPATWPALRNKLKVFFSRRTRDEWCTLLQDCDACVTPVLEPDELDQHKHNQARGTFSRRQGVIHPAPAPRFSRTPSSPPSDAPLRGEHGAGLTAVWGITENQLRSAKLSRNGSPSTQSPRPP